MTSYVFKRRVHLSFLITVLLLVGCAFVFTPALFASDAGEGAAAVNPAAGQYTTAWVCIAAAIAFGLGAMGAGMAISKVGSAAMGAISERPEIASNALIFIALAEGLVVFGFITALMILAAV